MKLIIIVRADRDTETGVVPTEERAAALTAYHEELAKAGVLLDANRLQPSSQGFRLRWHGNRRVLVDGPFGNVRGLVACYTLIQVKSRAEGVEWAKRFPPPFSADQDGEIEVRPLYDSITKGASK